MTIPSHRSASPWLRFNLLFWPLLVAPFALIRIAALLSDAPDSLYQTIYLANPYVIPLAMVTLWLRAAYVCRRAKRDMAPYLILGAAMLACNWALLHPSPWRDLYAGWIDPDFWAATWLPAAVISLLAYAFLLKAYLAEQPHTIWRITGAALGSALLVLTAVFTYAIDVPGAARQALKSYLATRPEVTHYEIEDTRWTHSCCAESILVPPARANYVRYRVRVFLTGSRQELEIIDFYDKRDEAAQMDDLDSGIGGHQHWQLRHLYRPGETVPPDVWEI